MSDDLRMIHDHQPNPEIACRTCGCEGFRLDDGQCDGRHEAEVFDLNRDADD